MGIGGGQTYNYNGNRYGYGGPANQELLNQQANNLRQSTAAQINYQNKNINMNSNNYYKKRVLVGGHIVDSIVQGDQQDGPQQEHSNAKNQGDHRPKDARTEDGTGRQIQTTSSDYELL